MLKRFVSIALAATATAAITATTVLTQGANPHAAGLVGLPNPAEANAIKLQFGTKALFAWDTSTSSFRSLATYDPGKKVTLFTSVADATAALGRAKTAALVKWPSWHHAAVTPTTTAPAPVPTTIAPAASTAAPAPAQPSSSSSMAPPAGYTTAQQFFEDSFAGTSLSPHWHTYISDANSNGYPWSSDGAGGSGSTAGSFDAEYFKPSAVSVNNGLSLTATPGSSQPGYSWTSGVVETQGLESISAGYVQIRAWMPDMSTGMWPGLWLMGDKSELPEIDLNEGGYTQSGSPNTAMACNLHAAGVGQQIVNTGADMSSGWHTYGIDYQPGKSLTYFLDGKQVCQYSSNVPSGPYSLIIDLQVAQQTSGWHTLVGSATPTPSVMRVAEVQFYGTGSAS
jgi:hypothetical protein